MSMKLMVKMNRFLTQMILRMRLKDNQEGKTYLNLTHNYNHHLPLIHRKDQMELNNKMELRRMTINNNRTKEYLQYYADAVFPQSQRENKKINNYRVGKINT